MPVTAIALDVTYLHGKPLVAYLTCGNGPVTTTQELPGGLVVDVAADGQLIGIELLHPAATTLAQINAVLARFGLPACQADDVQPLIAA